jgi:alanyl-tRNA synthetase
MTSMTERLYYSDSFLFEFEAKVAEVRHEGGRVGVVLDRTAFYPTSGGQVFDTGWLQSGGARLRVSETAEDESGNIVHYIDMAVKGRVEVEVGMGTPGAFNLGPGMLVCGVVDADRRRDHMQQHSGQHVLSAAFEKLFGMRTVSFHMGDESCTIDLETKSLSDDQVREAERESNRVVTDDRPVAIRSATVEQAKAMGVRKIPDHVEGELRLIDMEGYDLNACGGTHVRSTGQVGAVLLRKYEKVKQGFRVEFVCGDRAMTTARHDFETLTEAARLYDTQIWQVPELIRKSQDESKAAAKERKKLLEELAELLAGRMHGEAEAVNEVKLVTRVFDDRDTAFVKLLAQKITAAGASVALLGAKSGQAGVVFAQSPGLSYDMGALMKEALGVLGGRGGGNRDLAQGGAPDPGKIREVIETIAGKIRQV